MTNPSSTPAQTQEAIDALASSLQTWTAPPAVVTGDLNVGGKSYPVADVQFGSTAQVVLVFGKDDSPAPQGPGGRPDDGVLGAGIAVQTPNGDQRYVLDFDRGVGQAGFDPRLYEPPGPGFVPDPSAPYPRGGYACAADKGESQMTTPCEATEEVDPCPMGRTDGSRIADGLARADGGGSSGRTDGTTDGVEIDAADPDGQTLALVTPDWDLPDARQELVPLHDANLAVVPTYVVGDGQAPAADAPADARPDLNLTVEVVGLEEPSTSSRQPTTEEAPVAPDATAAADHLFQSLFRQTPSPAQEDAGSTPPEAAPSPEAASSFGHCLGRLVSRCESLLADLPQPSAQETAAAEAVAVEAILAFSTWRLSRSDGRTAE